MAKILIVDDEKNIREVVKEYALLNGYEAEEASNGLDAITMVSNSDYDCIILDIMMPKLDGFSTCKQIKQMKNIPIIMLSARQEEYDKLFGFELGVDDYVVKPFSPKELMARIKVVLDRAQKVQTNPRDILRFDGLVINVPGRSVTVDGEKVNLTPKEIDLLLYLTAHPNVALSRTKLLEEVWNYDYFGDDRTVDSHVKMLRHNLGRYRDMIVTVRGMGYKFEV
ncbi:MAG: response regulator transcription factor [Solobacterium sp.]|nr:response regulator transcription factor [Solobacterium sp.]MBR2669332.1 response regulator transcription factor [Solobacterium sp.]